MIRPFLTTTFLVLAAPAFAETFTADPRVDTVTIYPGLASVSRLITLDLPAGRHDVIVPGLPEGLSPQGLRVSAPVGTQLGAVNLANDRLPVTPDQSSPEIVAAKAEVERLEEALRQSTVDIAAIRLQVRAAEEQVSFLQSLSKAGAAEGAAIGDLQALAQMVGAETLALRQRAFGAEQDAQAAERAQKDTREALEDARQALAALTAPDQQGAVLTFTIDAAEDGPVTIDITSLEGFANWSPVYDMRLTTGDAPAMDIDRAVVISQQTGQDWNDVQLILSTARPGEQTAPSAVYPQPRRIISKDDLESGIGFQAEGLQSLSRAAPQMMEDAAAPMAVVAEANFSGATVTYVYPTRVDIRNGVDDLRLPLDRLSLEADVWAEAVPRHDDIAYRMAEFRNTTDEVLLPGQALLFADGTMIGFDQMPLLAAGAEQRMGFGPLDGVRLTRAMPRKSEGETGVFTSANQLSEQVVMSVENLTGQDWPVVLRDSFDYSEQDDLEVTIAANPTFARQNPEGRRGVLEWDLDVPAGEKQQIVLDYTLKWPNGYVLR
ncbi:MAG: mucoidy inhibitor MuiA family protein [Yoonia sp.]|uniref:DUF4139 domain-containing protein n=1 Tax=Yoonia sp. TaxID=2212373 RepID=UPI003EF13C32